MSQTRALSKLPGCTALLLTALVPAPGLAATLYWPGSPGCGGTLQSCVDITSAGDTVVVVNDVPNSSTLTIRRGIRLVGASSTRLPPKVFAIRLEPSQPVFHAAVDGIDVRSLYLYSSQEAGDMRVALSRSIVRGVAYLEADDAQSLVVEATGNRFLGSSMQVEAYDASRVDVHMRGNRFEGIRVWNGVFQMPATTCGISINSDDAAELSADLDGNAVECNYDGAIQHGGFSSIRSRVRVANHLAALLPTPAAHGPVEGYALRLRGNIDFTMSHSTLDGGAVQVGCTTAGCAPATVSMFNNILRGLVPQTAADALIDHGGNLYSDTPVLAGTNRGGNRFGDPRLRADGSHRLAAGSPAIGAGLDLRDEAVFGTGAAVAFDHDGLPRGSGGRPDIGAFGFGDIDGDARVPAGQQPAPLAGPSLTSRPLLASAAPYTGLNRISAVLAHLDPQVGWTLKRGPLGDSLALDVHWWQPQAAVWAGSVPSAGRVVDIGLPQAASEQVVVLRESGPADAAVFGRTLGVQHVGSSVLAAVGSEPGSQPMPMGMGVAVALLAPGAHAFVQTAGVEHLNSFGDMRIVHRELDDSPCAPLHITPVHPFAGSFRVLRRPVAGGSAWFLVRSDAPGGILPGQQFHIVLHRPALDRCRSRPIFGDGFEGP